VIDLNQYIGVPHKSQGRDWFGVDCWGLICLVYADLGIELPRYLGWYNDTKDVPALYAVANEERNRWQQVETPQPLDVILFTVPTKKGLFPAHVGLMEQQGQMIHCEHGHDVARERYDGPKWSRRVEGFFRYV